MPVNTLPRKLVVYLAAPPGDGLRSAREHFQEYVKPMLVAAAVDWDVVEGRREGDVRAGLAERIRQTRRRKGEPSETEPEADVLLEVRQKYDIEEEVGAGDIIIGRHTWKEYIRGLHEGWLGPIDAPRVPAHDDLSSDQATLSPTGDSLGLDTTSNIIEEQKLPPLDTTKSEPQAQLQTSESENVQPQGLSELLQDDANPAAKPADEQNEPAKEETKPKPAVTPIPPYILPASYQTATLSSHAPQFSNSIVLPFPHLLGFLNTPIRIYRFLNRRHLADDTGRQVASILLNKSGVDYEASGGARNVSISSFDNEGGEGGEALWEQQRLLAAEEADWHKSARKPNLPEDEHKERPWLEPMSLDSRIGSRMRKPERVSEVGERQGATSAIATAAADDGSEIKGNSAEWRGGADRPERIGWGQWLKEAAGFETEEPKCKGWEHGAVGSEED